MTAYVDRAVLHVAAGKGGNGCASIHREKFRPLGGPDGGNGGDGGDVTLMVDRNVSTLLDFQFRPHAKGGDGKQGQGDHRNGAFGASVLLRVPDGTVVVDSSGTVVADMIGEGTKVVIARGGIGGRGNAALAGPRRRAPGFALFGVPGEVLDVTLELKSVADVALVGFPSAGKSSLIGAVSAAHPKVADYPFTTLQPHLGVVRTAAGDMVIADVPGLIPGASKGKGLGLEFLRHVERCSVLLHVLDCATLDPGRDPISDLDIIEAELSAYGGLERKPRMVVLNKVDVPEGRELAELVQPELEARGLEVHSISAVSREGLRDLTLRLAQLVTADRESRPELAPPRLVLRPEELGRTEYVVTEIGEQQFAVTGTKPERWVLQTDFGNTEAIGFLADRLDKLGVEKGLADAGAQPGAEVSIGGYTFDWEPTGRDLVLGPRGSDVRIDDSPRMSRAERDMVYASRRTEQLEDDLDQ